MYLCNWSLNALLPNNGFRLQIAPIMVQIYVDHHSDKPSFSFAESTDPITSANLNGDLL